MQDPADEKAPQFAQIAVLARLLVKQVSIFFPEAHVYVHAGTVFLEQRLRHKGRGLVVTVSDILDRVFEFDDPVRLLGERTESKTDLVLAGGSHFVMMELRLDTDGGEGF